MTPLNNHRLCICTYTVMSSTHYINLLIFHQRRALFENAIFIFICIRFLRRLYDQNQNTCPLRPKNSMIITKDVSVERRGFEQFLEGGYLGFLRAQYSTLYFVTTPLIVLFLIENVVVIYMKMICKISFVII